MERGRRLSKFEIEVEELQTLNEQLNVEIHVKPWMVSDAIAELKKYVELNRDDDKLVAGFETTKDNPYGEKAGCVLL